MAKTLITYFGTYGTTKKFAEGISELTGGDLFEIEPVKPYDTNPENYEELVNYAKKERDNDERPAIKTLPNVADYDYIFIGYPMWWYTYPQIIRTFIESVDLSGKTIIPFNTHEGSGDGGTYKELQEALPNSKVLIGLPIRGQNLKDYDQKGNIKEWLDELKINWSE